MTVDKPIKRKTASEKVRSPWGERMHQALGGRTVRWLSGKTDVPESTLSEIMRKAMPGADTAFKIAQVLDVPAEWLISGDAADGVALTANKQDWLAIPRYHLADIGAGDRSKPSETVPVYRDWLTADARRAEDLWFTDLPGSMSDGSAQAGDLILCHNVNGHDREGGYLYFLDDMAIVRRLEGPVLDAMREGRQVFDWRAVEPSNMRLVARILGTIKLRPL